jgi:hypothetical protein
LNNTAKAFALILLSAWLPALGRELVDQAAVREIGVSEIRPDVRRLNEASFARPVSIAHDGETVYVVDADDHAVRMFTKEGFPTGSLGKRGQAPGEFDTPSDVDIREGRVYVTDRFNKRIQFLDKKGRPVGGFKVPFSPDQICVLEDDRIVVSHLPLGIGGSEPMIHCFSREGKLLWEREESCYSGDRTYDLFQNFLVMVGGGREDVWIVRKSGRRTVSHLDAEGKDLGPLDVAAEYVSREASLPIGRSDRTLSGFCWDAAFREGVIGLLAPEPVRAREKDLGPGRKIHLIGPDGRVCGIIGLPEPVSRIDLDGDLVYAIDLNNTLRVFRTEAR